jgi:hypothetical protein
MNLIKKYNNKIKRNIRDYGFKKTIIKLFFGFLSFIFERKYYRIYKKEVKVFPDEELNLPSNEMYFKEIQSNDFDLIMQIENEAEWLKDELEKLIENGMYCLTIIINDKIIALNMINFGTIYMPLVKYKKTFNRNSSWSEHIAVDRDYRKLGLATILRKKVFNDLSDRGIKWLYGGCLPDNTASLNLARKMKFKEILDICYTKIFIFKYWKLKRIKNV